jgi:hypothetical protein
MKSLLTFTNVLLPLILGGCAMGWSHLSGRDMKHLPKPIARRMPAT